MFCDLPLKVPVPPCRRTGERSVEGVLWVTVPWDEMEFREVIQTIVDGATCGTVCFFSCKDFVQAGELF